MIVIAHPLLVIRDFMNDVKCDVSFVSIFESDVKWLPRTQLSIQTAGVNWQTNYKRQPKIDR